MPRPLLKPSAKQEYNEKKKQESQQYNAILDPKTNRPSNDYCIINGRICHRSTGKPVQ